MSLYSGLYRERRSSRFVSGEFSRPLYNIYHFGIFRSISQKSLGVCEDMDLYHNELLVIYKLLTDVELSEEERCTASHLVIKFEVEGKVKP